MRSLYSAVALSAAITAANECKVLSLFYDGWRGVVGGLVFAVALSAAHTLLTMLVELRPLVTASKAPDNLSDFDFLVVGGGSAGAVVAARLVQGEPSARVCLVEAGREDTHAMGGGFFKLPLLALFFKATRHHWGYETVDEPELQMAGSHWAPDDGKRGRPLIQTRGKVLGGCSSINLYLQRYSNSKITCGAST